MKRSKKELMDEITKYIGDDQSDTAIMIMEDLEDSISDDVVTREEYNNLDKTWRDKYISRFKSGVEAINEVKEDIKKDDDKEISYEELLYERVGE